MSRRLEGWTNAAITMSCLALGGWLVGRAQERPNVQVLQAETGMQVVLETVQTTDGRLWVRPKTPVFFRLSPKEPQDRYAPLPPHTLMVCRQFNYKGTANENHAGFLCGADNYALEAFGFTRELESDVPTPAVRHKNLGVPAGGELH